MISLIGIIVTLENGLTNEKLNERRRENYANNKEKYKEYYVTWYHNNVEKRLLTNAKARAKKDSLDFDLSVDDVLLPKICPYLKTQLSSGKTKHFDRSTSYSLDRIDPSKGYVKGNVEVISHLANAMKQNATKEQLLEFAYTIIERYGNTSEKSRCSRRGDNCVSKGESICTTEQISNHSIEDGQCSGDCYGCRSIP